MKNGKKKQRYKSVYTWEADKKKCTVHTKYGTWFKRTRVYKKFGENNYQYISQQRINYNEGKEIKSNDSYVYDKEGRMLEETYTYVHNENGEREQRLRKTKFKYDKKGRLIERIDESGELEAQYEYEVKDGYEVTTEYSFNEMNKASDATEFNSEILTLVKKNKNGKIIEIKNTRTIDTIEYSSFKKTFEYDSNSRLVKETRVFKEPMRSSYRLSTLTSISNVQERSSAFTHEYDRRGRLALSKEKRKTVDHNEIEKEDPELITEYHYK